MLAYVIRRLLISAVILLVASFLMYMLVSFSGDPLSELLTDQSPNKQQKIDALTARLNLDEPLLVRYFIWLGGAVGCFLPGLACDLGENVVGQSVNDLVASALGTTLKLVLLATVLSIVLGVSVGIVSALRQYSRFDYTITFVAFLFFSLPIFWVAVLLKQFGAIELNNWFADPTFSVPATIVFAALIALTFASIMGGDRRRHYASFGIAFVGTATIITVMSATQWFADPTLGPLTVLTVSAGVAVGITALTVGIAERGVLLSGLLTALAGFLVSLAANPLLINATWLILLGLGAIIIAIGLVLGYLMGGIDRATAMRNNVIIALAVGFMVYMDYLLGNFETYTQKVGGRPVATIGSETPNFTGNFWQTQLDSLMHLILPTLAIMLISFATYSRYTRASMLETLKADYVRTARAKGLLERTVVLRHAFRNALIPVTTLAALDFGAVIGGAVITETVFGWKGMGQLFVDGLDASDVNQVMGFFLVVAVSVLVFNLLADLSYAWLDPRIRLD